MQKCQALFIHSNQKNRFWLSHSVSILFRCAMNKWNISPIGCHVIFRTSNKTAAKRNYEQSWNHDCVVLFTLTLRDSHRYELPTTNHQFCVFFRSDVYTESGRFRSEQISSAENIWTTSNRNWTAFAVCWAAFADTNRNWLKMLIDFHFSNNLSRMETVSIVYLNFLNWEIGRACLRFRLFFFRWCVRVDLFIHWLQLLLLFRSLCTPSAKWATAIEFDSFHSIYSIKRISIDPFNASALACFRFYRLTHVGSHHSVIVAWLTWSGAEWSAAKRDRANQRSEIDITDIFTFFFLLIIFVNKKLVWFLFSRHPVSIGCSRYLYPLHRRNDKTFMALWFPFVIFAFVLTHYFIILSFPIASIASNIDF